MEPSNTRAGRCRPWCPPRCKLHIARLAFRPLTPLISAKSLRSLVGSKAETSYERLRHAFLYGEPGFRPRGPHGPGIAERVLATSASEVDWRELLPQPDPAAVKAEVEKVPGVTSVSVERNGAGKMVVRGSISVFVDGARVSVVQGVDGYLEAATPAPPVPLAGRVWSIEMKIKGTGLRDMLCPASVTRTRTGAWLVKGRGPSRRYSTQSRAVAVARERDRRYAADRVRGPR
jgi:hypothetical protein